MINPMGNRVLAKPQSKEESVSKGGVILLSGDEEGVAVTADVVACGPECCDIKVGDLILLSQFLGDKVEYHNEYFVLVPEPVVLATIDRE